MAKNLLKLKIENIAKKLLNKNQLQLYNNDIKNNLNTNQLSSDESTIKDSLSEFEDMSKTLNQQNSRNLKNKNILLSKNSILSNSNNNRHHSSLCTKMTSLSDNHSRDGTLDNNSNFDANCKAMNLKNKNNIDKNNNKSNDVLIKNIIENNANNINLDLLNNLLNINKKLIELFNYNKNIDFKNNPNLNEEMNKINKDIKISSYKYINFIFNNEMELLIKLFYNNMEINKYFLSQIYLFISIIFLKEENIISNSYLIISYRSILFYSLLNLENIINIINVPLLLQNKKILNNIESLNKIILSILKVINPKIPSNSQIKDFISPSNTIQNNINDNKMKNSGLLKLISLLKENAKIKEKLILINDINEKHIKDNKEKDKILNNNEKIIKQNNINKQNISKKEKINKKIENNNFIKSLLPKMDINKYKYSIAIELDETLVHYCEEDDNYYAKVRFGSENFLKNISNLFEIIVVSTSGKEYSNIIIDNINKDDKCYVEHRLYTEDFKEGLNLSNINRDLKKIVFVCHDANFLNVPKNNVILLKEFNGEEEDREIVKLNKELKLLMKDIKILEDNFDIRNEIPLIMKRIKLKNYYLEEGEADEENK